MRRLRRTIAWLRWFNTFISFRCGGEIWFLAIVEEASVIERRGEKRQVLAGLREELTHKVIEPIFETDSCEHSFGFCPTRSARALVWITSESRARENWMV